MLNFTKQRTGIKPVVDETNTTLSFTTKTRPIEELRTSASFTLCNPNLSFIEGVGSILDFTSTIDKFNCYLTESDAVIDTNALLSDWTAVGNDLHNSMKIYYSERILKNGDNSLTT